MDQIPDDCLLRESQILGRKEISKEQAEANRRYNAEAEANAAKDGKFDKKGNPLYTRRPTRPRPAIAPLIPIGKSAWWQGIKEGRYPKPVKIGGKATFWTGKSIKSLTRA